MSGGHWMLGARLSRTVTLKEHWMSVPLDVLVRHVTSVVPMGKRDPDGGLQAGAGGGLHVAVSIGGGYSTTAPPGPVHSTAMSGGQIRPGVESWTTTTSKWHWASVPEESLAVQRTVVVPSGKKEPLGGSHTTSTSVSQRSEIDGGG